MRNVNNTNIVPPSLTQIALGLASHGFRLIPVHAVSQGSCTCRNPACKSPAKHPCMRNWPGIATNDRAQIERWFTTDFPDSNVGIVTGAAAGTAVLDVDARHGGEQSVAALETEHGELPETPTSKTGGGGWHFYFKAPGIKIKNSAGAIGPGLDIRGEGGFVVAPPSVHASGQSYTWLPGRGPGDVPMADMPPWLLAAVRAPPRLVALRARQDALQVLVRDGAVEGNRHNSVTRLVGYLLHRHVDPFVVLELTRAWNSDRNTPPLDDAELTWTVDSIAGRELNRRGGSNAR